MKIGIIREGKVPVDKRVALLPQQCIQLQNQFPEIQFIVQTSPIRSVLDEDYAKLGIPVQEDLRECDILFGVKEVPIAELIPNKTYFFFSHTIKKQPYNRELLRAILAKNIRLLDYERLTDTKNKRLVAFGRFAGIVGTYNGILTYGKRFKLFNLTPAHILNSYEKLQSEYAKVQLPPIKIALTGHGRVGKGSTEVLDGMGIKKVTKEEFVQNTFEEAVYVQLTSRDYYKPKANENQDWNIKDFYKNPENFERAFSPYLQQANLIISAHYWDPKADILFTKADMKNADFKAKVIADITCDIEGSIPSTLKPSTIEDPIYDYNPQTEKVETFFVDEQNVTVMAVDNLPCELPIDASESFGDQLSEFIFPSLVKGDAEEILKRATITENGKLTEAYQYLQDYVDGKE